MGGWRFGSERLYVLLFVCGDANSSGSILSWSALTFCFVALLSRQHAVNSDSQTPSDNFLENTNRLWSSLLESNGVHSREFRSYWDIRLFKKDFIWAINMACGLSLYIWEEVMSPLDIKLVVLEKSQCIFADGQGQEWWILGLLVPFCNPIYNHTITNA